MAIKVNPVKPILSGGYTLPPRPQVWLNLGLPMAVPLDTMEFMELRGDCPEWVEYCDQRNKRLEDLLKKAEALAPGEEMEVTLKVTIRRASR